MAQLKSRKIILASRPIGEPKLDNFRLTESEIDFSPERKLLLKTHWLSLDPYMRGMMDASESYAAPVAVGDVMPGGAVSEVLSSAVDGFAPGEFVVGYTGWQDYVLSDGRDLRKIDPTIAPISTALGVLGMPGMTAYVGLAQIGKPKAGETLVVAAASGAVGSVVGQIGKILGCHVVGIAGGPQKKRYVTEELGFHAGVDHCAPDFAERLKRACPKGIDVYFENVGGAVWEAVFPLLNHFARVPVCGLIAHYNDTGLPAGPNRVPQLQDSILAKRLTLRGFIVDDFDDQRADFLRDATAWFKAGQLKFREDVVEGLENAPRAFIGLLRGENFGKLIVKL